MQSGLIATVLLTRDKALPPLQKLGKKQALDFMLKNDFCNPHQLLRSRAKMQQRRDFFAELFSRSPVYLLNTIETPQESLDRLKNLIS
jgi:hypothetical protein